MRLAVVAPGHSPDLGGVETVVTHLSRALADIGVDVEVWVPGRGLRHQVTEEHGPVVVRRFPATRSEHFSVSPSLWRHVARHAPEFDLLHAHSYHSAAALGLIRPGLRTPYVFTGHYHGVGHTAPARVLHLGYRYPGRRLIRRAGRVLAVSAAEQRLVHRDFAFVGDVPVIHHGVDAAGIAASEPWDGEAPTVLVVGRLERYKRIDRVIDAFERSAATGQLVVLGAGPDRGRLQSLVDAGRRRGDIRFLGRVPDEDLYRWLRTAAVVVNMSEQEAFGLVALEGVAAGARVLLSDLPAHREVAALAPPAGIEIIDETRSSLTTALAAALSGPRRSPTTVRRWEDAAREHLRLYDELLVARRPARNAGDRR